MEIKTKNELAALILGVSLGHDLRMTLEHTTENHICFGDFEAASVTISKCGNVDAATYDNMRDHLAIVGAINEAEILAAHTWQAWGKGGAKNA